LKILLLTFVLILNISLNAAVIKVTSDDNSLVSAIEKSSDGDTILLAPGTYTLSEKVKINKAVIVASNYIYDQEDRWIDSTIFTPAKRSMHEWFELSAKDSRVIGFTFIGNSNHILNISASYAYVSHCKFYGGKDQLSFSGAGGYVGYCYFENAGDDALDCDQSIDWIIEHNMIVNAFQDGIEIRLHDKKSPLTKHYFRYNTVIGAGESGIQLIDYKGDSYREFYINNNVFQYCHGAGVSCMYKEKDNTNEVYRGSLMKETAFVYNNTFSGCNYGITISPGLLILNNMFINSKTVAVGRGIYVDDRNDLSITDYSCFYDNKKNFDKGVVLGKHNLIDINPHVDQSLLLKKGNILIDKGTAEFEWKNKKLVISKDQYLGDKPDIGAFEYGFPAPKKTIPIVSIGKDKVIIYPNNRIEADGVIYENGEKTIKKIEWSKIEGPGSVTFSDIHKAHTKIEFAKQGVYKVRLTAWDGKRRFSDVMKVYYVKDYAGKSVKVDKNKDALFSAVNYAYLAGDAEADAKSGKVIAGGKGAYCEYRIGTKYAGTYFIWIHLAMKNKGKGTISAAFDDLNNEKEISIDSRDGDFGYTWKKVTFKKIPEGYYPLIVKAKTADVIWDKIFVTCDAEKTPKE
jgi:hypothetical protein